MVAELAKHFLVFNYARRGRGTSGDTPPYAVEREIEDLEALISMRRLQENVVVTRWSCSCAWPAPPTMTSYPAFVAECQARLQAILADAAAR